MFTRQVFKTVVLCVRWSGVGSQWRHLFRPTVFTSLLFYALRMPGLFQPTLTNKIDTLFYVLCIYIKLDWWKSPALVVSV